MKALPGKRSKVVLMTIVDSVGCKSVRCGVEGGWEKGNRLVAPSPELLTI